VALLLIVVILMFMGVTIVCPYLILRNRDTSSSYWWITVLSGVGVSVLAYALTFHYVYSPRENTRIHGWPVPYIIFQRSTPDGPWLDFVGPTTILGFPINLVLLLGTWFFLLWILNAVVFRRRKGLRQKEAQEAEAVNNR